VVDAVVLMQYRKIHQNLTPYKFVWGTAFL